MSVQTSTETADAPIWSGWQSAVINGVYPLHRLVHGSENSAVFLTERKGQPVADAALKIIPIERVTLAQLSHWRVAAGLSHPHLIQLFDAGLCQLAGRQFLFVVMEYAEQTLGEVLSQRALTPDEVRDLLPPALEALTFLHRKGLVLGHLKPANILVVSDQVKLASDSIRPTGAPRVGIAEPSFYDPPEANHAPFSAADDIWGLGVTLVEALTQRVPWPDEQSDAACLPATVPPAFVDTVQRCLSYNFATRPSVTDLEARLAGAPEAPLLSVPEAAAPLVPLPIAPPQETTGRRGRIPAFVAIASLVVLAAVWAGLRLFHSPPSSRQSPAVTAQTPAQQPAISQIAAQNPAQPPGPAVVHEQLPSVSRGALKTIHGHIRIAVLVVVDRSGAVIDAHLKNTGPSSYFAHRAWEAARKWRFTPADAQGSREWLLRFEFTRSGVTGSATEGL
ncbi:MAG: protein kinase [Steroidobacteraceae bacterium]